MRAVQRAAGLAPTPLEVPTDEWMPASDAVDFADTTVRGPARSRVEHDGRRRSAGADTVRRPPTNEDDEAIAGASGRHVWPWIVASSAVLLALAATAFAIVWTGSH